MLNRICHFIVLGFGLFCGTLCRAADPVIPGVKADIEFANVTGVSLTLDAFVPEGPGPFPACILVHGGGWMNGTKRSYITPIFDPLSKAGYAWFTINYRLAPAHKWPACAEDVAAAVKWVKAHAAEYKVDVKCIALIGESAGAHLAAWVGTQEDPETRVAAVIPFYLPGDLEFHVRGIGKADRIMKLLELSELNDDAWKKMRDASPINQIKAGLPPFLLIHGNKDTTVAFEQSQRFQEKLKAAGNVCDLITVPGGGHGMGGWDKLKSDYREQMIKWLDEKLKK